MTFLKKPIAILIISILALAPIAQPPVAQATDWAYAVKEYGLDLVARVIARTFFQLAVNSMLQKIQTGGRNGGTAFIQNWRNFQTNAQYRGEDVFRAILANTQVCDYLKGDLRGIFRVSSLNNIPLLGQNIRIGSLDPYTLRARCTLPQGFDVAKFRQDFAGSGGWATLLALTEPQNNPYGLFLLSQAELQRQRDLELSSDINEAQAGSGYTSFRTGCEQPLNANSRCTFMGHVITPAQLIANGAGQILDKNLEWLTNADEISEAIVAISAYITQYFSNLSTAAQDTTDPSISDPTADKMEYCTAIEPSDRVKNIYTSQWDPYRIARRTDHGPCGKPDSDNIAPFNRCVTACLKALGVIPATVGIPSPVTITPPPTPAPTGGGGGGGGGGGSGNCQTEHPSGTNGQFTSVISSAIENARASSGALTGDGQPYNLVPGQEDTYMSAVGSFLQGRGLRTFSDPGSKEIGIYRPGDTTSESYAIRTDTITRNALKGSGCPIP